MVPSSGRIAFDRTGHAAGAAPAAPQFAAGDGDHLDAVPAQVCVGYDVALVSDDHAGLDGEEVAAVVPLLAFGGPHVLVGGEHCDLVHAERLGEGGEEVVVARDLEAVRVGRGGGRPDGPRLQPVLQVRVHDEGGVVDHRQDRVEVHHGVRVRQLDGDDPVGRVVGEQAAGQVLDAHRGAALPEPDHDSTAAEDVDVAALQRGRLVMPVVTAIPDGEPAVGEHRMELVDRRAVHGLADPR